MPSSKRIRTVLALPSDEHGGSNVGLMRPTQWQFIGGNVVATPIQRTIWNQWIECWEWVEELRKKSRLIVVNKGESNQRPTQQHC